MGLLIPLLKKHNLSIEDLTKLCNVSKPTIYNWNKTGIVNKKEHRILLKKYIPEFDPKPRNRKIKTITNKELENIKPPQNNYKKQMPKRLKIKVVLKK